MSTFNGSHMILRQCFKSRLILNNHPSRLSIGILFSWKRINLTTVDFIPICVSSSFTVDTNSDMFNQGLGITQSKTSNELQLCNLEEWMVVLTLRFRQEKKSI